MSVRLPVGALAFVAVLWCAMASVWAEDVQPEADIISGVVLNSVTQEPIGRALVVSTDDTLATLTDAQGRFEFRLPEPAGTASQSTPGNFVTGKSLHIRGWALTARKPGYVNDRRQAAEQTPVSPGQKDVTLSLTPEALIVGRVIFSDPVNRADVEIYRREVREGRPHWISAGTVQTRSNGEFRFAELTAGKYKLFTHEVLDRDPLAFNPNGQLYGYPPVYFPAANDFGSAGIITLAAGQTFQANVSPVRQAYYQVKVSVRGAPAGQPFEIIVSTQGHRGPGYSLGYDPGEQVITGMLPNGNYTVEAVGYGGNFGTDYSDARQRISSGIPASGVINIAVTGAALDGAVMTVVPHSSIPVNVTEQFTSADKDSSSRLRLANGPKGRTNYLNVGLEPADDFASAFPVGGTASKQSNDSLSIQNVAPGRYWVRVDTPRGFVSSITSGGVNLLRHPLVVGFGGAIPPIEVTLRDDGADVDGSVESISPGEGVGKSLPSVPTIAAYLVPLPDSGGEFRQVVVGGTASFSFAQVPPGTYRVLAFDREDPELEYGDVEAMQAYDGKGIVVRLVAGAKEHVKVPLISSGLK